MRRAHRALAAQAVKGAGMARNLITLHAMLSGSHAYSLPFEGRLEYAFRGSI
jgi:hypothetical protein